MKRKNIISLTIALTFLALSITGILIYLKQKNHIVNITHTMFGLIFVGFAIFHIINNWASITGYSKEKKTGKFQKELMVAASIFGIVLVGSVTEVFEPIAEAGKIFGKKREKLKVLSFEEVKTNQDLKGTSLRVLLEENKEAELPVVVAWVEDTDHKFVNNLFVPAKQAEMPESKEEAEEGHFDIKDFKPETLPAYYLFARWLVQSKFGRVLQAIRDAESRVMFSGYNPVVYKLTIWVISAVMCGVAGALYVPQVGIINPSEMSPANSIEIAIWAAVGGRATLIGPIVGAFLVNGAKSWFTVAFPEYWLYFLGAIFIAVTLYLPQGIVGLLRKFTNKKSSNGKRAA